MNKLSTLNTTTQSHNLPVSLEQDIQDEEEFIFWIEPPQKITMVCAAAGGHFGIYEPLPQAMLKPEIHPDIHDPPKLEVMLMSLAQVITKGHVSILPML